MSEVQLFIKKLTEKYGDVTARKAYGLDSFYVKEKIFVVITKDDKIALKVEDYSSQQKISQVRGIEKWRLNDKEMKDWLVLPTFYNKKKNKLSPILEMVHTTAIRPKKQKK
ncbi:MAG: hypothetical protein ISR65_00580 [Bacteriovoracaceae bacterium]|nr:hypothetical protein [Bacteriovoracaceae bacterium]